MKDNGIEGRSRWPMATGHLVLWQPASPFTGPNVHATAT